MAHSFVRMLHVCLWGALLQPSIARVGDTQLHRAARMQLAARRWLHAQR